MPMSYPRSLRGVVPSSLRSKLLSLFPASRAARMATPATPVIAAAVTAVVGGLVGATVVAQSLQGSHESLVKQNLVASQHDYAYYRTPSDVEQAVAAGVLIPVHGNGDFELAGEEVSYPYARPEVATFLGQLGAAYRGACGEPLVVTSLTRPITRQPWNASPMSVHPTGMAVDLRRSDRRGCRQWLESTLLALEGEGMVQATREHWPAHYHVAVFPDPLLLPGPIGDPNGVVRLAALHHQSFGTLRETDDEAAGHVQVARSSRTGRLRIAQTGAVVASRHGSRAGHATAAVHHTSRSRRRTAHSPRSSAVPAVSRHRVSRSHPSTQTRTVTAR
jgi:hypothetical protein